MIAHAHQFDGQILKFPTLAERTGQVDPNSPLTLRSYYESCLLPELSEQAPSSLKEDRTALNHWERLTDNPDIRTIGDEQLRAVRDQMIEAGYADATINKTWRELRAMLAAANDDGFIDSTPYLKQRQKGRRVRCRLVQEQPKRQREIVTEAELERLWIACKHATYPKGGQFPAPLLWRSLLVVMWTYGARTLDVLKHLEWDEILWTQKLFRLHAHKTRKIQGLPITPAVEKHLRQIKGHANRVFPGFNSPGCFLHKTGKWKRGFYTTWKNEICRNAGIEIPIQLKHFRERVVTHYNEIEPGLGAWIAGHFVPGVTAQNYDLPTKRIRDVIESAPVPACFID